MLRKEIDIINKRGLHARAAAKLVTCATQFESEINISRNNRTVSGKSIMGVMMLAASKGSAIELTINGTDEQLAMESLTKLIMDRFGEED